MVPTFVSQALREEDLTVHGDGTQTRSFCFIDDLVRAVRRVATTPEMSGDVINLGSTREITIRQLAETVLDLTESDAEIVYRMRPEDDPETRCPEVSRAKRLLDWTTEISLREGLERTINDFDARRAVAVSIRGERPPQA